MTWKTTNTAKGDNKLYSDAKGVVPSLDLRFASQKNLNDYMTGQNLITFSRPVGANQSPGTYVDENGIIQLSSADTPRFDHDPTTGESLGFLIEESRTNILLNSATLSAQSVTTSATAYTLSFYGTGTVTLSGTSTAGPLVGTGANDRATLTFTPTAGALTLTVAGTVSNAQLEAGSFPTSYIPTTGTALTRSADMATISGSNFSSWYNQSEGSIYAAYDSTGGSPTRAAYGLGNTTSSQGTNNESNPSKFTWFDGITVLSTVNTFDFSTGVGKTAAGFTDTAVSICLEGGTVATGTQTAYTDTQIVLGARGAGTTKFLNGHLVRLTYFPDRLPDATLQAITAP